jgi:hypothetical protein
VIDLDALDAAIAESERRNMFTAPIVKDLIAELREARGERAAVVAFLRGARLDELAEAIQRGEHRREVSDADR